MIGNVRTTIKRNTTAARIAAVVVVINIVTMTNTIDIVHLPIKIIITAIQDLRAVEEVVVAER